MLAGGIALTMLRPMNTTGTGFSGTGRIVAVVCLILFQAHFGAFAQGRPDYQTVAEFFSAIQRNDTNTASQLLESHTNLIFSGYSDSRLPLLEAAAAGNVPLVKRLLELGARSFRVEFVNEDAAEVSRTLTRFKGERLIDIPSAADILIRDHAALRSLATGLQ